MSLEGVTCFIGTLYVFYLSLKCLRFLLDVLKGALFGGTIDFKKFGSWAVVTGCTDGIGKAYAKQLASKGLNIILMSRSQEKLEAVASEIEKEYEVQTKIIQVDFSGGHEIYEEIAKELENYEAGVLVNNVGVSLSYPEYFGETSIEITWKQINVNVLALTMMTRLIIPAMTQRKKGVIINVASFSGANFVPLLSEYSATKTYVDKFSANLDAEYADKGIIVQCVLPSFVSTKMSGMKPSLFTPRSEDYVRDVLNKVGSSNRCFGYWPHELQSKILGFLPAWLSIKLFFNTLNNYRIKALRRNKKKSS